jgi:hypothetical protein
MAPMRTDPVIIALECAIRHRMSFLLAQAVGHMNCNEDEECIPQDRASLLRPIANMVLVLFSFSSLAPGKHSVVLFMFH